MTQDELNKLKFHYVVTDPFPEHVALVQVILINKVILLPSLLYSL
jgi:hypothetical protein